MTQIRCPHGALVDAIEITTVSDKRPRYIADQCDCPRPHCPLCDTELDDNGRCAGPIECALFGYPVPVPAVH